MSKEIELNDIDDDSFVEVSVEEGDKGKYISISTQDSASFCTCFLSVEDFRKLVSFVESELKE